MCTALWGRLFAGERGLYVFQQRPSAGNGQQYSLNCIWALLQQMEGVSIAAQYGPERGGDVRHSQADTTAARRDLGHDPQYTIEQGLRRTLAWYRGQFQTQAG